jgi:hypothetical protein
MPTHLLEDYNDHFSYFIVHNCVSKRANEAYKHIGSGLIGMPHAIWTVYYLLVGNSFV